MPGTRKLGKTTDQRMAMLRQQVTDFLDKGRMETTVTRAKEIGWTSDKQYGNCIVLRSIDYWRKTTDDEWQPIIGDWVYYLPMQKSKPNIMYQQKTKVPEQ